MTLSDIERVVGIIEKVQPQVALTVQAVIGLAKWIGRRRAAGEAPPTNDAVLAGWNQAKSALDRGHDSLSEAQRAIDERLKQLS